MAVPRKIAKIKHLPTESSAADIGWGMQKLLGAKISGELRAFRTVARIISANEMPALKTSDVGAFSIARTPFVHIAKSNSHNWFTYSRVLGYPSSELSANLDRLLGVIRNAYSTQNVAAFGQSVEEFVLDGGLSHITEFIHVVEGRKQLRHESDFAYVIFRQGSFSLDIGAAEGSVLDYSRELDNRHRLKHGIIGAWLVDDVAQANADIHACLSQFRQDDGRYLMKVGKARSIVSRVLRDTGNVFDSSSQRPDMHEATVVTVPTFRAA